MESLAVKYRPKEFSDVCGQQSVIKILNKQIETKTFSNVMLFSGASGCGKTTLARIVANKINNGLGQPIEIDAASNNGVDNIRQISEDAQERAIDCEYKVYIIDECHMITTQGWNAFLKTIEEPPKYTLFFFCTTDPQKIPATIKNRCQTYKISTISDDGIIHRLDYICNQEGYTFHIEALELICRLAQGSMRQAISYLDKCKDYSTEITLQNVIACLGDNSYDLYFDLTNAIIDGDKIKVLDTIERLHNQGNDLKVFVNEYLNFMLDLNKYCLLHSIDICKIPRSYEEKVKYTTGIENNVVYFNKLLDKILNLKVLIKNDSDVKSTIQAVLITDGQI